MDKIIKILKLCCEKTWWLCKVVGKAFKDFFTADWTRWVYRHILTPPIWAVILMSVILIPLVIVTLLFIDNTSAVAIIVYCYAAYAFTVLCIAMPKIVKRSKELIHGDEVKLIVAFRKFMNRYKYTGMFLNDRDFRARISLYGGLVINLAYAVFKIATGIYYYTPWPFAIGVYFLMLGLIRLVLMKNVRISDRQEHTASKKIHELKSYRTCGISMLVLTVGVMGVAIQMIWKNRGYEYPGFIIYISALYTFYSLILSVVNVVRFSKRKNAVLSAAKNLSLAGALMSLYALQTAMLTTFGGSESYRRLMNSLTGAAVCLLISAMGIFMIIKTRKKLQELEINNS